MIAPGAASSARKGSAEIGKNTEQMAVVRIPGSIQQSPIFFFSSLEPLTASLVAKVPEGKDSDTAESRSGVIIAVPSGKTQGSSGQWYVLLNPEKITAVGTPISLEAEVVAVKKSGTLKAQVGEIVPDSVAAWRRLKGWRDAKKDIPSKIILLIDESAEDVRESVLKVLEVGSLEQINKEGLLKKYEAFSQHLGEGFDYAANINFDLMRHLSTAIVGVRAERLAWAQALTKKRPVLNPKYSVYLNTAGPAGSPPLPTGAAIPKANEAIDETGVGNTYEGYELLQALEATAQYKTIYQQARASVAICENQDSFASGTIIGKNLVLTCAHAVARPGHLGKPKMRDRNKLFVRLGYDFPKDPNTPDEYIPAKIIYEPTLPEDGSDPLDFVLLKADISAYETNYIQSTENQAFAIRAGSGTPEEKIAALKSVLEKAYIPIRPLPIADFEVSETNAFSIAGHPEGRAKLICNHGKILFPLTIEEKTHDEIRRTLPSGTKAPEGIAQLQQRFDKMYVLKKRGDGSPYYRYTYSETSPGIGVICSTVKGDSGGAAIADTNPPCVFGILVEGQPGRSVPWTPGIERHETLLPTTAIIKELESFHKEKDTGVEFSEPWYTHYQVSLWKKGGNGTLTPRQ
jgi:hypothetical protein